MFRVSVLSALWFVFVTGSPWCVAGVARVFAFIDCIAFIITDALL